jgi:hypothetical protein
MQLHGNIEQGLKHLPGRPSVMDNSVEGIFGTFLFQLVVVQPQLLDSSSN